MASVSTYLNFNGNTEAAFQFYRSVFKTEFGGPIARMGDAPTMPGQPALSDAEKNLVMNIALPILGGHLLMGTDAHPAMGKVHFGNNSHIVLHPDTRAEADRLFAALSEGGKVEMPMQDMFWGDYYGNFTDQFGVQWMINCTAKK
ncbi:MAG TPA: VOC family protein [Polyangiales bacterium]